MRPSPNKRRGPVSPGQPEPSSKALARPKQNFGAWWAWALEQADVSHDGPPIRINDEDRPVPGLRLGWPFSAPFERYVFSGRQNAGPMAQTMMALANPRGNHPHERKILFALLAGHTDAETVRALIGGCRRDFFEAASMRAFVLVYERVRETLEGVA